jgi:hypothetical protein
MIITKLNSESFYAGLGYVINISGIVLYNNGTPLFTGPTTSTALAPYTLAGSNTILQLNGVTLCTVTWSWPINNLNTLGINSDANTNTYNPGLIVTVNGYLNTQTIVTFAGFIALIGSTREYNTNLVAAQGTYTSVLVNTLSVEANGAITATGGITNMGWTQVNYFGSNGYLSFPGPGGIVYYILSGTVTSSDTSYFYVYSPVPCFFTGYVVYGINTPSQPQAQAPTAAGYPTSIKIGGVSFNLGGSTVGNYTTMIHYTVYCRT